MNTNDRVDRANLIIRRLERLSADSAWSHRASGLRRNMIRQIDIFLREDNSDEAVLFLEELLEKGHELLIAAGKEIPDPKEILRTREKGDTG